MYLPDKMSRDRQCSTAPDQLYARANICADKLFYVKSGFVFFLARINKNMNM